MQREPLAIIVLAAGLGKRMKSDLPKVLAQAQEKSLLFHVLSAAVPLQPSILVVVTGKGKELVEQEARSSLDRLKYPIAQLSFAFQSEQRGTGDAVRAALPALDTFRGTVLILCGDTPLITGRSLKEFHDLHTTEKATVSFISVELDEPAHYGRVLRDAKTNAVKQIKEAKDCSTEEFRIREINAGIYAVDSSFLPGAIDALKDDNAQKEFYLTDIVAKAASEGQHALAWLLPRVEELLGVNDRYDLSLVERTLRMRKTKELINAGVQIVDSASVFIDDAVEIAPGAQIGPNVQLLGKTKIGAGSKIEGSAYLKDCTIGENVMLKFGIRAEEVVIEKDVSVGPFAHLRPGTLLKENSRIGNFVETKKMVLGKNSKANHLTYLGDAIIGDDSNIGAGTITCNYDGYQKSETKIGKGVFIGSNTALVAPISIADGATIGAGSTLQKDVEADALAFTRSPLTVKPGWSKSRRAKKKHS